MPAPRVCFVTCATWPAVSESDGFAARALERRGATVTPLAWNDAAARFDGFDAVVFRSNWDYHHAPDAFLAWLARWEAERVRFWNPPNLVRWNLSKRYLGDLERAGIPVVPTAYLDGREPDALPALLSARGWDTAVVKPVLSASAHDTVLVGPGEAGAVARTIAAGGMRTPVMVQPFVEEIRSRGEWSLVFIDGSFTHAALKRPAAGEFRVQPRFGGSSAAERPGADLIAAARRALEALPVPPLYARVDGVETARGFVVMEVEAHEPGLFFVLAPEAAEVFAEAILRRVPS
jgi:glutathione synthase/RimK-type ligase-like ATP-grasp enzyme